jgi:hypothetical protein
MDESKNHTVVWDFILINNIILFLLFVHVSGKKIISQEVVKARLFFTKIKELIFLQ